MNSERNHKQNRVGKYLQSICWVISVCKATASLQFDLNLILKLRARVGGETSLRNG